MSLITFQDLPSTTTPVNANNLNNNFGELNTNISNLENMIEPLIGTVLYSSSGTASTFTLSDTASNYSYFEIYFRTNDGADFAGSVKVMTPNNKRVNLCYNYASGNFVYGKNAICMVNNNTISFSKNVQGTYSNNSTISLLEGDYIYITKVIGYK